VLWPRGELVERTLRTPARRVPYGDCTFAEGTTVRKRLATTSRRVIKHGSLKEHGRGNAAVRAILRHIWDTSGAKPAVG
jgi:hypothetical protein